MSATCPKCDSWWPDNHRCPGAVQPRAFRVCIDDGESFAAVTFGKRWNGWECPYFTVAEGLRVVAGWDGMFDPERNCFLTPDGSSYPSTSFDVWEGKLINGVWLYPIGAGNWCWDEWSVACACDTAYCSCPVCRVCEEALACPDGLCPSCGGVPGGEGR